MEEIKKASVMQMCKNWRLEKQMVHALDSVQDDGRWKMCGWYGQYAS